MIFFRLTDWRGWSQTRECAPGEVDGWIAFAQRFHYGIELWRGDE